MSNYPDGVTGNEPYFQGQTEYEVDIPITGMATVNVPANSPHEAIEIAKEKITYSDIDFFDVNEDLEANAIECK